MAEAKTGTDNTSIFKRKDSVGNGFLYAGNVFGKIFTWRH